MAPQVRPALPDPENGLDPLEVTKMLRRKSSRFHQGQEPESALLNRPDICMQSKAFGHRRTFPLQTRVGPYMPFVLPIRPEATWDISPDRTSPMTMLQPMGRNGLSETMPGTYRQGARWPRVAGPGVKCALPLLLLVTTLAGFGCAGARVDVAQQAPSDVPQPDFIIVERFAVSPEDVKLDRGLSAKALRGLQERDLNDEERKVGAAVATVMEEETVRLLRQAGIPAYLDSYAPTATRTTALLRGNF